MANSQMISKGSGEGIENARYSGGALNQNSYMDDGYGLAHDDSLLTGFKDDHVSPSGPLMFGGSKASPRTSGQFNTI